MMMMSDERQSFTMEEILPSFCKPMTKNQFLAKSKLMFIGNTKEN